MKRISILITVLFAIAACNTDSTETTDSPEHVNASSDQLQAEPVEARVQDGVQVVELEAGQLGFQPLSISLQTDIPARLEITRTTEQTCATEVKIPAFDIGPVELPLNEAVAIEFTPTESGEFRFVCGMDMQEGRLVVQSS